MARNWVCCCVVLDRQVVLLAAVGEKHLLFYGSLRQARRTGDGGQRWVEAASGQVTGSWGTRKTTGDRQLNCWVGLREWNGIVVDGQWTAPGRAAPGLLSVRADTGRDTPDGWARNLDSTTSWVGTPPAMRCRTQWGVETSSVPIHQFRCGVWRQQGQRRRGSNRAIPPSAIHRATLRSHTLSGEMQGLPTKDGVHGENC